VIACINGAVAGIGLVYALYRDVCFASSAANFSTAFVRRGIPAEHGLAWLLPRLIGQAKAVICCSPA
jgi:enoyl-CoA hydratase/carnithine racemase